MFSIQEPRSRWYRDLAVADLIEHMDALEQRAIEEEESPWSLLSSPELLAIEGEVKKCRDDFVYAARNYFWIADDRGNETPFCLWDSQELIYARLLELKAKGKKQRVVTVKSRRLGCSTLIEALVAWDTMFFTNRIGLVVSYNRDHTKELLGIMLRIYDKCPWWIKPRVSSRTLESGLKFDNPNPDSRRHDPGTQSQVMLRGANSASGVAQGYRISAAHLSEWCDWPEHVAREVIEEDLQPALMDEAFAFLESTAKGANNYSHRFWKRCEQLAEKSEWSPLFLPWFVDRTHVILSPSGQYYDRDVLSMREKAQNEWVRCVEESCKKYFNRWTCNIDQANEVCPSCAIGSLEPLILTDDQLAWMQDRRNNSRGDERSQKTLLQEQAGCITGDSRVGTDLGIIRIDEARAAKATETGTVTQWFDNGIREVVEVSTKFGRRVRCTHDHKFLLKSGEWLEARELSKGDVIQLSPPRFVEDYYTAEWMYTPTCKMSIKIDEDWGRFLGYFMGDGCLCKDGVKVTMDRKDQDVVGDVAALLERIVGSPPLISHYNGRTDIRSNNTLWRRMLVGLGLIAPYECGSWRRLVHVPECIWRSPKPVVRQFLSALIECDGHAYRDSPKTVFFTKWDQFAMDVQLLLLGCGVNSHICSEDKKKIDEETGLWRTYHGNNLQMKSESSNVFHREVGFISERKRTTGSVRPPRRKGAFNNEMEDTIASVIPSGSERVHDLTVQDVHRFGCNGIMVHNSVEEAFQVSGYQVFGKVAQDFASEQVRHPILKGFFDIAGRIHAIDPKLAKLDPVTQDIDPKTIHCIIEECEEDHSHDFCPLLIWEYPDPGSTYYVGADVSEGLGGNCDFSVGCVIKMAGGPSIGPTYQVAVWRSNQIGPQNFAEELAKLGRYYNEAEISVEVNRYDTVLTWLRSNIQYPNLYRWKHMDSIQPLSQKLGWFTNLLSRSRLHQNLRRFLEYRMFFVRSSNTAEEMKNFVKDDYDDRMAGADSDSKDDELIATMIALWCAYEGMFDETRGYIPLSKQSQPEDCTYTVQCVVCGHKDFTNLIPMEGEQNLKCGNEKCGSIRLMITSTKAFKGLKADPKQLLEDAGVWERERGSTVEYWEL